MTMTRQSLTKVVLIAIALLAFVDAVQGQPRVNQPLAKEMGETFGFVFAQKQTVEAIKRQHPQLALRANEAESRFQLAFGPAIKNLDAQFEAQQPGWAAVRQKLEIALAAQSANSSLNASQAEQFLETVNLRAGGAMGSPILQTLLIFHPDFIEKPEREFSGGYVVRFQTDGNGKSKGTRLGISVPKSWQSKEGNRPNIVQEFLSENGRGNVSVVLLVKSFPPALAKQLTSEQSTLEFLSQSSMTNSIPTSGRLVGYTLQKLDGLHAAVMEFVVTEQRLDSRYRMHAISYTLVCGENMVTITMSTFGLASESEAETARRFQKFRPLFRAIANSFSYNNQYLGK